MSNRIGFALAVLLALAGCAREPVRKTADVAPGQAASVDSVYQAEAFIEQGQLEQAQALLRQVTAATPAGWRGVMENSNGVVIHYWDTAEMLECSPTDAARTRKSIVWTRPSYSQAWYLLGFMAVERNDFVQAESDINRALQLEPDHPTLLNEKATIVQHLGRQDESITYSRKVIDSSRCVTTKAMSRAWRSQGVSLIELGKLDEAETALGESLKIDPGNPNSQRELDYIKHLRADQPKTPLDIHRTH